MKKFLSLALFLLLSSSLLHAKGGLEQILGESEQDLHLEVTRAIKNKNQKVCALDELSGSSVLPELKKQYEIQIIALKGIIEDSDEDKIHLYFYNRSKNKIKTLKSQLNSSSQTAIE